MCVCVCVCVCKAFYSTSLAEESRNKDGTFISDERTNDSLCGHGEGTQFLDPVSITFIISHAHAGCRCLLYKMRPASPSP